MNEFKVGDIIKGKKNEYGYTNEKMKRAKVLEADNSKMKIQVMEHEHKDCIGRTTVVDNTCEKFELICIRLTKQELLDMPEGTRITTDKGKNNIFTKYARNYFKNNLSECIAHYDIDDDLALLDETYGTKIIKVEKPTYEVTYERQKAKEMTISQIEKELGYSIKVVKESEDK